jgi:SAM-dependent methyltransferase
MTRSRDADIDRKVLARIEADPWLARIAEYRFLRQELRFALGKDLFASGGIDFGTDRLLRLLAKPDSIVVAPRESRLRVLDVGCGVGTLGIAIARGLGKEQASAVLTDRDRLAVAYARENVALNRCGGGKDDEGDVRVLDAALGYDGVVAADEGPFDLIVINVPASAGDDGIYELVYGAGPLLAKGGRVALVYVTPLDETMSAMREYHASAHGAVELAAESRGKEHVAQVLRFPDGLREFESDDPLVSWRRDEATDTLHAPGLPELPWYAVHDVPEFDTPHHETPLLMKLLETLSPADLRERDERILVHHPWHGLLAALLIAARAPSTLALSGRDELELAVAELNARRAAERLGARTEVLRAPVRSTHPWLPGLPAAAPDEPEGSLDVGNSGYDWITGHLDWKEGPDALRVTLESFSAALARTPDGTGFGQIVLACRSGQLEGLRRAARSVGLRDGKTLLRRGHAVITLRRR